MKLTINQGDLLDGLRLVGRAVAAKTTLPILSNVYLGASNGRLTLAGTDLEIGAACWLDAQVEEDGQVAVPARTLIDLVAALPLEPVRMELGGGAIVRRLHIAAGRYTNNVSGVDAAEFPALPTADPVDPAVDALLPAADLSRVVSQVAFAATNDQSRPILTAVLARFDGNVLVFAAADGFRLSVLTLTRPTPVAAPGGGPVSVLIPARAWAELGRMMGASGENFGPQANPVRVVVTKSRRQVQFHLDSACLTSQLIDGNFPDYAAIVPKTHTTRVVVPVRDLANACKVANVFSRESADIVRLLFQPGGELSLGAIEVKATSAETGDNAGELDAAVEGEPVEVALNCKYLLDALEAVGTERAALEMTTPASPVTIAPVGAAPGDEDYVHVLMPMQLGGR